MAFSLPSVGYLARQWNRISRNDQVILSILAVVIGAAAGYGAIAFRFLLSEVQHIAFGFSSENVFTLASELPWWHIVLAPTIGGLIVGLFLKYLMPGGRPEAVAHVIEAASLKGARMDLRNGVGAFIVSALSLGVGASTGREGPLVHFGATIGSWISQQFKLNRAMTLTLLGCGVASGVAASFNAPIAGVFFALEVVVGHYALHAFAPIVIASIVGTIVCRVHIGDFPAFILPEYTIQSFWEFPGFALMGLVCGISAMIFMRSAALAEDIADKVPMPDWLRPAAGGLAVGCIAVFFPHVLGVGYEATDAALKEQFPLVFLLGLISAKVLATAISLASRFGGGVFSPSLFIGAMTGGAYGFVAAMVFPEAASGQGLYAIVGMGAVSAAVLGAPMSTTLIIFEMTGDYRVTIAVMLAAAVASILTQRVMARSFFLWQLERHGVSLAGGRERQLLQSSTVKDVMVDAYNTVHRDDNLETLRDLLQNKPYSDFYVVDDDEHLVGIITFTDLRPVAFEPEMGDLINAMDIAKTDLHVLEADSNLEEALQVMEELNITRLPVVDKQTAMHVVGVARYRDVLRAYTRALLQARAEERGDS